MITIDKDRAFELLDLAVQANEPEHKNPQNWNFHMDGTPCCLVGTALNLAGFTSQQCYPGIGVGSGRPSGRRLRKARSSLAENLGV